MSHLLLTSKKLKNEVNFIFIKITLKRKNKKSKTQGRDKKAKKLLNRTRKGKGQSIKMKENPKLKLHLLENLKGNYDTSKEIDKYIIEYEKEKKYKNVIEKTHNNMDNLFEYLFEGNQGSLDILYPPDEDSTSIDIEESIWRYSRIFRNKI